MMSIEVVDLNWAHFQYKQLHINKINVMHNQQKPTTTRPINDWLDMPTLKFIQAVLSNTFPCVQVHVRLILWHDILLFLKFCNQFLCVHRQYAKIAISSTNCILCVHYAFKFDIINLVPRKVKQWNLYGWFLILYELCKM